MRFTFWHSESILRGAGPRPALPRSAGATVPSEAFRVDEVGRVGHLLRAPEFRANGGQA